MAESDGDEEAARRRASLNAPKTGLRARINELELEVEILREENRRLKLALQEAFKEKD